MLKPFQLAAVALSGLHLVAPHQAHSFTNQQPLKLASVPYDAGLFSPPYSTLSDVPESHWTFLSHPSHPGYGVRVKKSNFCDDTVKYVLQTQNSCLRS
jgi:hypothetical protein